MIRYTRARQASADSVKAGYDIEEHGIACQASADTVKGKKIQNSMPSLGGHSGTAKAW